MDATAALIFRTVHEKIALGVVVFDRKTWMIESINPHGRKLLGLSPEETVHRYLSGHILSAQAQEGVKRPDIEILQQSGFYADIVLRGFKGGNIIANCWVIDVNAEQGCKVLLIFQDMTLLKKSQRELEIKREGLAVAYQELLTQHEELRQLDLAKDKFIALISHELRTPISAMVTSSEMLVAKIYQSEEQREQLSRTLYEQANTLMSYVNAILDFTRLDAHKMDYFITEQSPVPFVRRQMDNFSDAAAKAGAEIRLIDANQPSLCFFDEIRLSQVIGNILNNAIKFIGRGSLIEIRLRETEAKCCIEITDDGVGISPEDAHKVFSEFEIIGETKTHHIGTGLGMPIAKRIMTDMGGNLYFTSEKGKGTTFSVEIPKNKVLDHERWYRSRPDLDDDLIN